MNDHVKLIYDSQLRLYAAQTSAKDAKLGVEIAQARCEQKIIGAAGGEKALGGNAGERARRLTIALWECEEYLAAWHVLAEADAALLIAKAEHDAALNQRRAEEFHVREMIAHALEAAGVALSGNTFSESPTEEAEAPDLDTAVDALVDKIVGGIAQRRLIGTDWGGKPIYQYPYGIVRGQDMSNR